MHLIFTVYGRKQARTSSVSLPGKYLNMYLIFMVYGRKQAHMYTCTSLSLPGTYLNMHLIVLELSLLCSSELVHTVRESYIHYTTLAWHSRPLQSAASHHRLST